MLLHDGDFSDSSVCTFYLEPERGQPLTDADAHDQAATNADHSVLCRRFRQRGHYLGRTTSRCSSRRSPGRQRGRSAWTHRSGLWVRTSSGNLMTNGDFAAGLLLWGRFRADCLAGDQRCVPVLQAGRHAIRRRAAGDRHAGGRRRSTGSSTFQLGRTSRAAARHALVDEDNFTDSACTFWLPPGMPLSNYAMRVGRGQAVDEDGVGLPRHGRNLADRRVVAADPGHAGAHDGRNPGLRNATSPGRCSRSQRQPPR